MSNPESFKSDLHSELLLQERLDENPKYRFFSWQVLRKASEFFGAKTYIGETGLTIPPFFTNARRGAKITWGALDDSPVIVNWNDLDPSEQAEIIPTLDAANNWIIFKHPLGLENAATPTPPIRKGAQKIFQTKGKAGRERGWWRTGTDNLPRTAWTPKCGLVRTAQFPTQISSPWKHSSRRNPKKIFRICNPRG